MADAHYSLEKQECGSQIKFEDINQVDKDDMEEMDIKWNMVLLSMRADKFWKKTGKKISIQGSDIVGFDKLKVECFNCHKMGYFARECRAPRSQDRGRKYNFRQGSKAEEHAPKALMAIDGVGWDWSYMANDEEDHALVADEVTSTEFALMANTSAESKVFDNSLCSKDCKKNNDSLNKKNKEGLGYTAVPPPTVQLYLSPKKDLSWTGLPECANDTITDYSRPSSTIESTSENDQNRNMSVSETVASPITSKPFIKFVRPKDSQSDNKTNKKETPKKPPVKYAKQYRKQNMKPKARGNQRNWNNLKSQQLGPDFVMKKKACFNCGNFNHLANDCRKRGSSQNKIDDKGYWDSGCSRHMTCNISYLSDFEPYDGGYVSFGQGGCKITRKGTIKTSKLEFKNVYSVKDLKYNLFSVSQICDNKNSVLFTDSECIVLGRDFKLLDDANILLRTPRQHNMYSIDLNNIIPHRDLTCLVAKASADECILWHRRL
nr:ribonuclease H-like domain-containing protein [Tanacetum cinerariifolium]